MLDLKDIKFNEISRVVVVVVFCIHDLWSVSGDGSSRA